MEELIRLEDVTVTRGGEALLERVSWQLRRGARWALWGPNGAGKSTLLELLVGRRAPAAGHVRRLPGLRIAWAGQDTHLPDVATLADLADARYRQGWTGIPKLHGAAGLAVGVAALNYEAILRKLRQNRHDNFTRRAYLRTHERLALIPRAAFSVWAAPS